MSAPVGDELAYRAELFEPLREAETPSLQSGLLARRSARVNLRQLHIAVPEQKETSSCATSPTTAGPSSFARASSPLFPVDQMSLLDAVEEMETVLGRGSYCVVRAGRMRQDGEQVALKTYLTDEAEVREAARRESDILRCIDHPNVVRCFGHFSSSERMVLVLERCQGLPLEEASKTQHRGRFHEAAARSLFHALLKALAHVHGKRIVHGDIKAENVIVQENSMNLKLIDFNSARYLQEGDNSPLTPFSGTSLWAAPEALLGKATQSPASDVWSAGLCLHMMLSGSLPREHLHAGTRQELGHSVTDLCSNLGTLSFWHEVSSTCKILLARSLQAEPWQRSSAADLLDDPWFSM